MSASPVVKTGEEAKYHLIQKNISKVPLKERLFPGKIYASELETSYWKEGFKRLNRKKFWAKYN
ncbi:hypothetical protein KCK71_004581 [Escherichia coli]|nr:hypothetical protein [Escherichia coli]